MHTVSGDRGCPVHVHVHSKEGHGESEQAERRERYSKQSEACAGSFSAPSFLNLLSPRIHSIPVLLLCSAVLELTTCHIAVYLCWHIIAAGNPWERNFWAKLINLLLLLFCLSNQEAAAHYDWNLFVTICRPLWWEIVATLSLSLYLMSSFILGNMYGSNSIHTIWSLFGSQREEPDSRILGILRNIIQHHESKILGMCCCCVDTVNGKLIRDMLLLDGGGPNSNSKDRQTGTHGVDQDRRMRRCRWGADRNKRHS